MGETERDMLKDLEAMVKHGVEMIRRDMEIEDDWAPIVFLDRPPGGGIAVLPIGEFMENEKMKDIAGEIVIPLAIKKYRSKAIAIVMTAWVVVIDNPGDDVEEVIDALVPPSKHPRRREEVVLFLADQTRVSVIRAEIKRPRGSEHPELGAWSEDDMNGAKMLGGRLWDGPIKALREE